MQWGFSFVYKNIKPGTELHCTAMHTPPANLVNVHKRDVAKTSVLRFSLPFNGEEGTFFHPMYYIDAPTAKGDHTTDIACSLFGKETVRVKFTVNFDGA